MSDDCTICGGSNRPGLLPRLFRTSCALLAALVLALPGAALAQGYAGLGTEAEGFALPDPAYRFDFPADHGPHPEFRIEWWYVTANLTGADGREYGLQWTLFRSALAPERTEGWSSPQIWMGHAGLTTPEAHFAAERFARDGVGQAGVTAEPFAAWIDEWRMAGPSLSEVALSAQGADFGYDVRLSADLPFVPQGDEGYSVKSQSGQASHYYSQPFYEVTGTLTLPEGAVAVTGQAWLDREWSSQPLDSGQEGWDWLSLHFDSGAKLMAFQVRDATRGAYTVGTWIAPDGTPTPYGDGAITLDALTRDSVAGRELPTAWRVRLAERNLDVEARALNPDSWMGLSFPYWEGPVQVTGSHPGRGYLEMTGYE